MLLHVKKNSCSPIKISRIKKRILHYLDVPADSRKCEIFGNTVVVSVVTATTEHSSIEHSGYPTEY